MICNPFLSISFQASFNYPSRQPSFKQNSSEADSQPDLLLQPSSSGGHLGAFINYVITSRGKQGKKMTIFTLFSTTFMLKMSYLTDSYISFTLKMESVSKKSNFWPKYDSEKNGGDYFSLHTS